MFELPPQTLEPPAIIWQAKSKTRSRSRERTRRAGRPRVNPAYYIGAIVLLSGDGETAQYCEITHQTPDGTWWCLPIQRTATGQ